MKIRRIYAWILALIGVTNQGAAPIANQSDQINSLVNKPLVYRSTRKKNVFDFLNYTNREGGEFKAFYGATGSSLTTSSSVVGITIPPSADQLPLVTLLPSDNLWSPITQKDKEVS